MVTNIRRDDHRDRRRVGGGRGRAAGELGLLRRSAGSRSTRAPDWRTPVPRSPGRRTRRPAQAPRAAASRAAARRSVPSSDRAAVAQAEQPEVLAEELDRAAVQDLLEIAGPPRAGPAWRPPARPAFSRAWMAWSANWRSSGSLELRMSCTVGLPTPVVTRLWIWAGCRRARSARRAPAGLTVGDRLRPRMDDERVDRLRTDPWRTGDVDRAGSRSGSAPAFRHLRVEGHLRLARRAREREADHQRDHDRVDDEQRHEQRRAAQDLEVLDAAASARRVSGRARGGSARTRPRSRAGRRRPSRSSSAGVPANRSSPSASTSTRSA